VESRQYRHVLALADHASPRLEAVSSGPAFATRPPAPSVSKGHKKARTEEATHQAPGPTQSGCGAVNLNGTRP
jgi:hypothetical protein